MTDNPITSAIVFNCITHYNKLTLSVSLLSADKLTNNNDILILGLGSEILTDDGLPLKIIADLKNDPQMEGLHYRTANTGGLDLLDHFSGFNHVIIIDTIKTKRGYPGMVWFFTPMEDNYMDTFHLSSYHDTTFPFTLALGHKLGLPVPGKIWILAVEIIEGLAFSKYSSELIESVYPDILKEIKEKINRTIHNLMVRPVKKINE
jgi:hydrogenase maturation protease